MKIYVKVRGNVIGQGKNVQSCLGYIAKLFREGHTDINVSGGRIGSWR